MSHRNAPLSETRSAEAGALCRRGSVGRCGEQLNGSRCRQPLRLAGQIGIALHGVAGMVDRVFTTAPSARVDPDAHRAAHHQGSGAAPLGACPNRLPARPASLDGAPGLDPLPAGQAALAGPSHRTRRAPHGLRARCGDLVHVDVKKLGKIPAGGGWRCWAAPLANANSQADKSSGKRNQLPQSCCAAITSCTPRLDGTLAAGLQRSVQLALPIAGAVVLGVGAGGVLHDDGITGAEVVEEPPCVGRG